jgi:hypothetical protein
MHVGGSPNLWFMPIGASPHLWFMHFGASPHLWFMHVGASPYLLLQLGNSETTLFQNNVKYNLFVLV